MNAKDLYRTLVSNNLNLMEHGGKCEVRLDTGESIIEAHIDDGVLILVREADKVNPSEEDEPDEDSTEEPSED